MAKRIHSAFTSLDGYVTDESGNFEGAELSDEVFGSVNDRERPVGTYLFGHRSTRRGRVCAPIPFAAPPLLAVDSARGGLATKGSSHGSTGAVATLRGLVTDADGLALPGVTITATRNSNGRSFITVTGEAGKFRLEGLEAEALRRGGDARRLRGRDAARPRPYAQGGAAGGFIPPDLPRRDGHGPPGRNRALPQEMVERLEIRESGRGLLRQHDVQPVRGQLHKQILHLAFTTDRVDRLRH